MNQLHPSRGETDVHAPALQNTTNTIVGQTQMALSPLLLAIPMQELGIHIANAMRATCTLIVVLYFRKKANLGLFTTLLFMLVMYTVGGYGGSRLGMDLKRRMQGLSTEDKALLMNAYEAYKAGEGLEIAFAEGESMGKEQKHQQKFVKFQDTWDVFMDMTVASEDKNFPDHQGYDRHAGAMSIGTRTFPLNMMMGERGGSTIGSQAVKNLRNKRGRGISDKMTEWNGAMYMTEQFDAGGDPKLNGHEEMLELYLNVIPVGACKGMPAAYTYYFGEDFAAVKSSLAKMNKNSKEYKQAIKKHTIRYGFLLGSIRSGKADFWKDKTAIWKQGKEAIRDYCGQQGIDGDWVDGDEVTKYVMSGMLLDSPMRLPDEEVKKGEEVIKSDVLEEYARIQKEAEIPEGEKPLIQASYNAQINRSFVYNTWDALSKIQSDYESEKMLGAIDSTQVDSSGAIVTPESVPGGTGRIEAGGVMRDKNGLLLARIGGSEDTESKIDHAERPQEIGSMLKPFFYYTALQLGIISSMDETYIDQQYTLTEDDGYHLGNQSWSPGNFKSYSGASKNFAKGLADSDNTAIMYLLKKAAEEGKAEELFEKYFALLNSVGIVPKEEVSFATTHPACFIGSGVSFRPNKVLEGLDAFGRGGKVYASSSIKKVSNRVSKKSLYEHKPQLVHQLDIGLVNEVNKGLLLRGIQLGFPGALVKTGTQGGPDSKTIRIGTWICYPHGNSLILILGPDDPKDGWADEKNVSGGGTVAPIARKIIERLGARGYDPKGVGEKKKIEPVSTEDSAPTGSIDSRRNHVDDVDANDEMLYGLFEEESYEEAEPVSATLAKVLQANKAQQQKNRFQSKQGMRSQNRFAQNTSMKAKATNRLS